MAGTFGLLVPTFLRPLAISHRPSPSSHEFELRLASQLRKHVPLATFFSFSTGALFRVFVNSYFAFIILILIFHSKGKSCAAFFFALTHILIRSLPAFFRVHLLPCALSQPMFFTLRRFSFVLCCCCLFCMFLLLFLFCTKHALLDLHTLIFLLALLFSA